MKFKKQLVKFDTAKIINLSLVMFLVPLVVFSVLNLFVFGSKGFLTGKLYLDIIIFIVGLIVFVIFHEALHAFAFILFGKANPKEIKFGIAPKQGMVYCTCNKPMKANAYLIALMLPVVITGIIPLIIVCIYGNVLWIVFFSIMVSGGAGDFIMMNAVRKYDGAQLILDHPIAPAFYLVYNEGEEPNDFVEATQEMENELVQEMKKSPFEGKNSKNNLGLKIIKILLFLSVSVIVMAIIGVLLML